MGMLIAGTRESATLNIILVVVKLVALGVFVAFARPANFHIRPTLHPFMPYGFVATEIDGAKRGVMAAAAIVFFAFYGFDAVATSAEEAKNPGARPDDRHRRVDGGVHADLHGGGRWPRSARCRSPRLANSPEPLALWCCAIAGPADSRRI